CCWCATTSGWRSRASCASWRYGCWTDRTRRPPTCSTWTTPPACWRCSGGPSAASRSTARCRRSSGRSWTGRSPPLAEDGKVIGGGLAWLAERRKGGPGTPASLREVGGVEGVGTTFLEETFAGRGAPPEHRRHAPAARKVLKALLPEAGSDLRGA